MDRHVSPFPSIIHVGKQLAHEIFNGESTLLKYTCLAILGEDNIIGGQSCCGANSDTLFAG